MCCDLSDHVDLVLVSTYQTNLFLFFLKKPVTNIGSILLAELVAINMTLQFIVNDFLNLLTNTDVPDVVIFSDSQSVVGILTLGWESTQYQQTVQETIKYMNIIKIKGANVDINWSPGHAGIQGNELADKLAKEASKLAESMDPESSITSHTDIRKGAHMLSLMTWQKQWDLTDRGRNMYNITPDITEKHLLDYPTKNIYSLLARLRTGYCGLNSYLFKISISDTKFCECGEEETVTHYLLECSKYFDIREQLRTNIFHLTGKWELTLDLLLGNKRDELLDHFRSNLADLLSEFIVQSGRL